MSTYQSWFTKMHDMQRSGRTLEVLSPPLKLCWKKRIKKENLWDSPVIGDGVVYISSSVGLFALNLIDGTEIWKLEGVMGGSVGSPTIWQDWLCVNTGSLYAIDRHTGKILWQSKIKGVADSVPCTINDQLFCGSIDGLVYAIDITSGERQWTYQATDEVRFSPSVKGNVLCFGSIDSVFHAVDISTRKLIWQYDFQAYFGYKNSAPIYEDIVLVSVEDVGLNALDLMTGKLLWTYKPRHGPSTVPCVADGVVYVASSQLHAVEAKTGKEIWTSEYRGGLSTSSPIISGDYIYIGGGHSRFVYAFNRHTGEKVWEYEVGDIVFSTPAIASGKLLVGCHDGYLYCFEEK